MYFRSRSGGVEINGLGPNAINRKKAPEPVLEISKFIPNDARLEFQISIRALVQTVLENSNTLKVKVIESCTEEQDEDYLLSPVVQASLTNTPLVQQDIEVLTSKVMDISGVAVVNKPLSMESHCLILIVKNLLETTDV